MMDSNTYQCISFDLGVTKLRAQGVDGPDPYRVIREYMESHGFVHDQRSGYISARPMTRADALLVASEFAVEQPGICSEIHARILQQEGQRDITDIMRSLSDVAQRNRARDGEAMDAPEAGSEPRDMPSSRNGAEEEPDTGRGQAKPSQDGPRPSRGPRR